MVSAMNFFISEHMTVERVDDNGIAHCSVRVPVDRLDDIMALADHMIHASRWLRTKARVCEAIKPQPSRFKRLIG